MKRTRPFDTRQLEAFDTLCATGSFTETAKRLLLTQSAISHSMRTLEDETGCQLIRRQGKKVSLTEAGVHNTYCTCERLREESDWVRASRHVVFFFHPW